MGVEEQVTEGSRVASRWVCTAPTTAGPSYSEASRSAVSTGTAERSKISDSIALLGQIGVLRTLVLGLEILTRRVKLPKGVLKAP